MSNMSNLCLLLEEIIEHSEGILEAAKEIRSIFSEEAETPALSEKAEAKAPEKTTTAAKAAPAPPAKELSFTELRAKLAEKSRAGFTADIKKILLNHGAEKLSAIQPADYETVLKEVEALSHE